MRGLKGLLLASTALVGVSQAQAACPVPNNYPFVEHCPLTAGVLNAAIAAATGMLPDASNAMLPTARKNLHAMPTVNVRDFGATGNASTDDSAAFQAAINSLSAPGGVVYVPPGNYCIKTMLTISLNSVSIVGDPGMGASYINTCGSDNTILTLSGSRNHIRDMIISGARKIGTTNPAVILSGVQDQVFWSRIDGGSNTIKITGPDMKIAFNELLGAYGNSVIYIGTGGSLGAAGYLAYNKIDQGWPGATPNGAAISGISPWAGTTGYTTSTSAVPTIVSLGGYLLQATVGGTSGGSAPTLPPYNTNVVDGTVTWQLVGPQTYYGILADTGATSSYINYNDLTGPYAAGFSMQNTLSGNPGAQAPQQINAIGNIFGGNITDGILLHDGAGFIGRDNSIANCTLATCNGVRAVTNWVGDATLSGNRIYGNPHGIVIAHGTHTLIGENDVVGASVSCININGAITDFSIVNNNAGTSATWGACVLPISIDTAGANHYVVNGNDIFGAGGDISDLGAGPDKFVGNNPGSGLTSTISAGATVASATLSATSNTTLATVTGLSVPLLGGRHYNCRGHLSGTSTATGGLKAALVASNGLTASGLTATGFLWNGTTAVANTTVTALGSNIAASTAIYTDLYIDAGIVVNAPGTINVQAAQNASDPGATTVSAQSTFACARAD